MKAVSDPLRNVLDRLDGVKQRGRGYMALCPAHDDRNPSLSVREGDDGRVLVKCFAGCDVKDITHAMGLTMGNLFLDPISPLPPNRQRPPAPPRPQPAAPKRRKRVKTVNHPDSGSGNCPIATYRYCTANGATVRVKARYITPEGKKDFRWFSPTGEGDWYADADENAPATLYGAERLAAQSDADILLTESEKDKDALQARDLLAVAAGGADNWHPAMADQLAGRDVAILTHNDEGGRAFTRRATADLVRVGAIVRDVRLPGIAEKGDVVDWLDSGGTAERLIAFVAATPIYVPDADDPHDEEPTPESAWDHFKARAVDLANVIENGIEPVEPFDAEEPDLLVGCVTCIIGGPEQGKTILAAHKIIRALRADKRVLLIDEEMGVRLTAERLDAMGARRDDLSRLIYFPFTLADFGGNLEAMAATITEGIIRESVDLIVMDSVSKLFAAAGMDENSNSDATRLLGAWITPAAHVHGRTVLLLDHTTKVEDDGKYGRGAGSKLADVDVQWHIQAAVPPTRTSMGRLVLSRKKDRLASVPATINYLAGGDGTGALNVRIEGSDATTAVKVRESDRSALLALYGEHNTPLRFAEWQAALKRTKSTFTDSRRRLVNARLIEQRDDFYHVSATGIEAIKDDLDIRPKQPPLTDEKNAKTQKSGTVATSPDDPDHDPIRPQTTPRRDTLGTDAPKTREPIHGKEKAVGTDRYGVGTGVPIRTSQTEGGKEGTEGTAPLKGPYLPYLPPDAPAFDEDEAFDTAVGVEAEEIAWEWIVAVKAEREFGIPDAVCVAAVRLGCALDRFASAEDEAVRLAEFLDRDAAMTGGV